jgi:hypothetical protein
MVRVARIAGNGAGETGHHRHERAAVQAERFQHAIHQERDARHVARVLQQPDEEKQQQDLRQKNDDVADAADDAARHELAKQTLGTTDATAPESALIRSSISEMAGSDQEKSAWNTISMSTRKIPKPPDGCKSTRSTRSGRLALRRVPIDLRVEVGDGRVDERVASEDDVAVEVAPFGFGFGAHAVRSLAERGRHADELVRLVDARERPERERTIALDRAPPARGQRFGNAVGVSHELARVRDLDAAAARRGKRAFDRTFQGIETGAEAAVRWNDRDAEESLERLGWGGFSATLVDHIQRQDERHAELGELEHEVEIARELSVVDHDHGQGPGAGTPRGRARLRALFALPPSAPRVNTSPGRPRPRAFSRPRGRSRPLRRSTVTPGNCRCGRARR